MLYKFIRHLPYFRTRCNLPPRGSLIFRRPFKLGLPFAKGVVHGGCSGPSTFDKRAFCRIFSLFLRFQLPLPDNRRGPYYRPVPPQRVRGRSPFQSRQSRYARSTAPSHASRFPRLPRHSGGIHLHTDASQSAQVPRFFIQRPALFFSRPPFRLQCSPIHDSSSHRYSRRLAWPLKCLRAWGISILAYLNDIVVWHRGRDTFLAQMPGWIAWLSSRQMNHLSFHESPDKSQISYFLLCNYIDLFIPVAIPESDRLFNHAQSHQLAGDKGHTIWPGTNATSDVFSAGDGIPSQLGKIPPLLVLRAE